MKKGILISFLASVIVAGFFISCASAADDSGDYSRFEIAGGIGRGLNDLRSTEAILLGAWKFQLSKVVDLRIEPNVEHIWARDHKSMFFAGASPVFRFSTSGKSVNPFADIGCGMSGGTTARILDRSFGKDFFFSPTAGAGVKFGGSSYGFSLFARWLHHSNAGFFHPNEGIDSEYVMLGYNF